MNFFVSVFVFASASALTSLSANADYVGRFAKYVTTVKSANSAEVKVGESTIRVIALDLVLQKYSVNYTNSDSQGVPDQSSAQMSAAELDAQTQGTIFNHCSDNNGVSSIGISVKGTLFQSCLIKSSNTEMYIGLVPFSVLKSVSTSYDGKVYTTTLVDYQF